MLQPHSGSGSGAVVAERRGFLKKVTAALTAIIGAAAAIPGLGFLAHPLRKATVWGGEEPLRVAAARDVKPGEPLRVDVVGQRRDGWLRLDRVNLGACWLVRSPEGEVRAFSTVCPHLGCGIDWDGDEKKFVCPCHGSDFDTSGRVLAGPSPRAMDELDAVIAGNDVKVRYRRFRVATSKKEPIG